MRETQKGNKVYKRAGGKWGTGDLSEADSKLLQSVPDLLETTNKHLKMEASPRKKQNNTKQTKGRGSSDLSLPVKGVVIPRKCNFCQHHEVGIKTKNGYLQLKPGMKIVLLEE